MTKQFGKFLSLRPANQIRLVKAAFVILFVKIALKLMPFNTLRKITSGPSKSQEKNDSVDEETISRIVWSVNAAARRMPWASTCLTRALAVQFLLARAGERSNFQIGVMKDQKMNLQAHAWLEVRGKILVGGEEGPHKFATFPQLGSKNN